MSRDETTHIVLSTDALAVSFSQSQWAQIVECALQHGWAPASWELFASPGFAPGTRVVVCDFDAVDFSRALDRCLRDVPPTDIVERFGDGGWSRRLRLVADFCRNMPLQIACVPSCDIGKAFTVSPQSCRLDGERRQRSVKRTMDGRRAARGSAHSSRLPLVESAMSAASACDTQEVLRALRTLLATPVKPRSFDEAIWENLNLVVDRAIVAVEHGEWTEAIDCLQTVWSIIRVL